MKKTTKKQLGFSLIELVIIIVIIAVIGALVWVFATRHAGHKAATQPAAEPVVTAKVITPDTVAAKVREGLAAKYAIYEGAATAAENGDVSVTDGTDAARYKVAGDTYYITYNTGASLIVTSKYVADSSSRYNLNKNIRTTMADSLKNLGLSRSGVLATASAGLDVYATKNVTCTVTTPTDTSANSTLACGAIDEYIRQSAKIKPIAAAVPNVTANTVIELAKIEDGSVIGYERAYLTVNDILGAGYQAALYKRNNTSWTFFKGTQNGFLCTDFTTQEQKDAFDGTDCYDSAGKVQTVH